MAPVLLRAPGGLEKDEKNKKGFDQMKFMGKSCKTWNSVETYGLVFVRGGGGCRGLKSGGNGEREGPRFPGAGHWGLSEMNSARPSSCR